MLLGNHGYKQQITVCVIIKLILYNIVYLFICHFTRGFILGGNIFYKSKVCHFQGFYRIFPNMLDCHATICCTYCKWHTVLLSGCNMTKIVSCIAEDWQALSCPTHIRHYAKSGHLSLWILEINLYLSCQSSALYTLVQYHSSYKFST